MTFLFLDLRDECTWNEGVSCHMVQVSADPHYREVYFEAEATVPFHNNRLCNNLRNLHCSWNNRIMSFHGARSVPQNGDGQAQLKLCNLPKIKRSQDLLQSIM